jgi:hypothetical protein
MKIEKYGRQRLRVKMAVGAMLREMKIVKHGWRLGFRKEIGKAEK